MKSRTVSKMSVLLGCGFLCFSLAPTRSLAQEFPTRPVTISVGYGPGDNMDLMTRALASKVEKILGQPFIILNRPGAAGAVALGILSTKEKPDGYQLAAVIDTPLDRMPLVRKLNYKMEDFAPIMQFAAGATGVVIKSTSPWKTFPELIKYAKENPGKVSYTTTGAGTTMDIAFQYIAKQAGIEWTHVPYPGAKQGLGAVLGGHVTAAVGSTQWVPEVKDGSLRLLAITSGTRMSAFPDVSTIRELGYDISADSVCVLVAPKGTPPPIVNKLNDAFRQAMDDPEFVRLLQNLQMDASYRNSEESRRYMEGVSRDFSKVITDLKIPTEFDTK